MARTDPQIALRIPTDLKDRVVASAKANNRSINAEICFQLQRAYQVNWTPYVGLWANEAADRMDSMAGNS